MKLTPRWDPSLRCALRSCASGRSGYREACGVEAGLGDQAGQAVGEGRALVAPSHRPDGYVNAGMAGLLRAARNARPSRLIPGLVRSAVRDLELVEEAVQLRFLVALVLRRGTSIHSDPQLQ